MATRATYKVGSMTFYCHWDGYPAGAAHRFANMIEAMTQPEKSGRVNLIAEKRGGIAFAFIRGNDDAEPTKDHEEHSDTEWRYTIAENQTGNLSIIVHERLNFTANWRVNYIGGLVEWVNKQRLLGLQQHKDYLANTKQTIPSDENLLEGFPEVVEVPEGEGNTTTGFHHAVRFYAATKTAADAIAKLAADKAASYPESNPNRKVYASKAQCWAKAAA